MVRDRIIAEIWTKIKIFSLKIIINVLFIIFNNDIFTVILESSRARDLSLNIFISFYIYLYRILK